MIGRSSLYALCFSLIVVIFSAWPACAQSAAAAPGQDGPVVYDLTREIKMDGTILKIELARTGVTGTHLIVATSSGPVDVHVGVGPATTAGRLGLAPGQSVEITGMMATINGNSILLARTLTAGQNTITLRNQHGIPVRSILPPKNPNGTAAPRGGL